MGVFIRGAIDKVLGSSMHPVAKGAIVVLLFAGLGAVTYFGLG